MMDFKDSFYVTFGLKLCFVVCMKPVRAPISELHRTILYSVIPQPPAKSMSDNLLYFDFFSQHSRRDGLN